MTQTNFAMGTLVRINGVGSVSLSNGSVGRIYGRCRGSSLYNVSGEFGMWRGERLVWSHTGAFRSFDINVFPGDFEVIEEGT